MSQSKENFVDLHTHSNYSDGAFSPAELIRRASKAGLRAIALTDHDTIDGLKDAAEAAKAAGIEFVPGVEISAAEEGRELHILAYYPVERNQLKSALSELKADRHNRMRKMVSLLQGMKMKIEYSDLENEAGGAAPGRMHLARLLVRKRYVHTVEEAFTLYLKRGREAYVPRKTFSVPQTLELIISAGAVPVIAHPKNGGAVLIKELAALGLQGVEAYHPEHDAAKAECYSSLAREMGLLVTGGSDYHGAEGSPLSDYPIKRAVPYSFLEEIKKRKQTLIR